MTRRPSWGSERPLRWSSLRRIRETLFRSCFRVGRGATRWPHECQDWRTRVRLVQIINIYLRSEDAHAIVSASRWLASDVFGPESQRSASRASYSKERSRTCVSKWLQIEFEGQDCVFVGGHEPIDFVLVQLTFPSRLAGPPFSQDEQRRCCPSREKDVCKRR